MSELTNTPEVIDAQEIPELSQRHKNFIRGLRELADFYETRPELAVPSPNPVMYLFSEPEDLGRVAKLLGKAKKVVQGESFFCLVRHFGPIELQASWNRSDVCERVKTGTRTVPAVSVPEHEEDTYEWRCPKTVMPQLGDSE